METDIFMWEILVPTERRRDGKPIRTRFHRVWDEKVRVISGGLTIMKPAKGQWLCPEGNLYSERMIPVRFLANEEQMNRIVNMTAVYYDQLVVLAYRVGTHVVMRTLEDAARGMRKSA